MIKVKPLVDFSLFFSFFLLCRLMENANIFTLVRLLSCPVPQAQIQITDNYKVRKEAQISSKLGLRLAHLGKLCYLLMYRLSVKSWLQFIENFLIFSNSAENWGKFSNFCLRERVYFNICSDLYTLVIKHLYKPEAKWNQNLELGTALLSDVCGGFGT